GCRYDGEWRRGLPHGKGVMKYANGDQFRGRFEAGSRRTGKGEYVWANGIERHVGGEFALGERWGIGVTTSKDGSFHSGQYRAGRAQGEGQEEAKGIGMLYEGEYANGLRHGQGCASTSEVTGLLTLLQWMEYEGEWVLDTKDGFGTLRRKSGAVLSGHFKMDRALGGGELLCPDGSSYQGEFMNGVADGRGVYRGVNRGDVYQGEFMAAHRHGRGRLSFANGDKLDGEFCWNKLCGRATFQSCWGAIRE
ncbi:hypothetical protein GUITHDRAFT_54890, partial [Guillardia theta CCMP2712]